VRLPLLHFSSDPHRTPEFAQRTDRRSAIVAENIAETIESSREKSHLEDSQPFFSIALCRAKASAASLFMIPSGAVRAITPGLPVRFDQPPAQALHAVKVGAPASDFVRG